MILRRYYNSKRRYPYYFHPELKTYEDICKLAEETPEKNVFGLDNAEYEFVLEPCEQQGWWDNCCNMIRDNTRYVLDNLDYLPTFKVNWNSYYADTKRITIGNPKVVYKYDSPVDKSIHDVYHDIHDKINKTTKV